MVVIRHKETGEPLHEVQADTLAGADLEGAMLLCADRNPIVTVMGVDDPSGAIDASWERSEDGQSRRRDFDVRCTKPRSA